MSRLDLSVKAGTNMPVLYFYVRERDGVTAVNVTGFAVTMSIRSAVGGTLAATVSGSLVTAASGYCSITMKASETLAITPGVYQYEIDVTLSTDTYTPLEGFFTVVGQVSA